MDLGIGPTGRITPIVSAERCQWQEALTGFERLRNQAWTTQTPINIINCFLVGFHISGLPWFTQLFLRFCFNSSIASLVFFFPNVGPLLVGSGKCRELWCCNGCYIQRDSPTVITAGPVAVDAVAIREAFTSPNSKVCHHFQHDEFRGCATPAVGDLSVPTRTTNSQKSCFVLSLMIV